MAALPRLESLLGLRLEEARERLEAAGATVRVVASAPPRPRRPLTGPWRVVRLRPVGDAIELVAVQAVPMPEGASEG